MALSLSKVRELTGNDEGMLSLVKGAKEANRLSLEKNPHMAGHAAEVIMVMDFSGSMQGRYNSGEVQAAMERILALACEFDDDGTVPVIFFHDDAWVGGEVDLTNFKGSIDRMIGGKHMGRTSYSAAINEVLGYYQLGNGGGRRGLLGRHKAEQTAATRQNPVYVAFFTDGEPNGNDVGPAEQAIRDASSKPVFWQFIGLGQNFQFLEKLDDMGGREVDNADFFSANRLADMSDADLFAKLLDEYPGWVKTVQAKGWIAA